MKTIIYTNKLDINETYLSSNELQMKEIKNLLKKINVSYTKIIHDKTSIPFEERNIYKQLKANDTLYIYDLSVLDEEVIQAYEIINNLHFNEVNVRCLKSIKVAGYVRVSTEKQAKNGISIEAQKEAIIKKAKELKLIEKRNDINLYIDEGFSASNFNRKALQQLMQDIRQQKIKFLIAYDTSRISRNIQDSNYFLGLLHENDVHYIFINDDIRTDTANDRLITQIKFVFNSFEKEKTQERTNFGLLSLVEDKKRYPNGGTMPFGYYRDKNKQIQIDIEMSYHIKRIFQMAKNYYTVEDIREYLNQNVPSRSFANRTVISIIKNELYIGVFKYKGKIYYDIVPAIVDEDVFKEANKNINRKTKKASNKYVFGNLVYCDLCKSRMTKAYGTGKMKKPYYYYTCKKHGNFPQIQLLKLIANEHTINKYDKKEKNELKVKILKQEARLEELKNLFQNEEIDVNDFIISYNTIEDKLNSLRTEEKFHSTRDIIDFDSMSDKELKIFFESHIRQIIVNPKDKTIKKIVYRKKKKANKS